MVGIINWLKGYLRIRIRGAAVERFMNLCAYKNILLWDVKKAQEIIELSISLDAFRSLRPIVRKTQIKVVILERVGLPFFITNINKRKIFVMGTIFTLFFWQISGNFIWNIEINGNYRITTEQIVDYLDKQEIRVGMWKNKLHIENLEKNLRVTFPDIIWTSGKLEGTTLVLAVKEVEGVLEMSNSEEGIQYDMLAPVDGEIYSMIVRKGVPKVKPGDIVTKDSLLVEGVVPVLNDDGTIREELYVKADADIYIKHTIDYEEMLPLSFVKKSYTGRVTKIPYLRLGEKELFMGHTPDYLVSDVIIRESISELMDEIKIPLSWGTYTYREYLNEESLYTSDEAKEILEKNFFKFLDTLSEKGVQIIEKNVKIVKDTQGWIMNGQIQLAEPVTETKKVEQGTLKELENL